MSDCHSTVVEDLTDERGLSLNTFPAECPYIIADILNPEFFPLIHLLFHRSSNLIFLP
jgi:hypothetical protein